MGISVLKNAFLDAFDYSESWQLDNLTTTVITTSVDSCKRQVLNMLNYTYDQSVCHHMSATQSD